jgi:hypothetical protein
MLFYIQEIANNFNISQILLPKHSPHLHLTDTARARARTHAHTHTQHGDLVSPLASFKDKNRLQ